MIPDQNPEPDSGQPWNTNEIAVGDLTCEQMGRLATAYIGALRIIVSDIKSSGLIVGMESTAGLLALSSAVASNPAIAKDADAERTARITMTAICLAGLAAAGLTNPDFLGKIGAGLLLAVNKLPYQTGPIGDDDVVVVECRRGPLDHPDVEQDESILQFGMKLESIMEESEKLTSDKARIISEIIKKNIQPE